MFAKKIPIFFESIFILVLFILCTTSLISCRIEKPDTASAALAILNKHPADYINQLVTLDALISKEMHLSLTHDNSNSPLPLSLADSLYQFANLLKPNMLLAQSDTEKIALFNSFIFDSLGLKAIDDTLDIRSSLPSQILIHRQGSCLGLVLFSLGLAEFLKLPLSPVFLPGHIFLRYQSPTHISNIEMLKRGIARSDSFYRTQFNLAAKPWYQMENYSKDQALIALLFNLANFHMYEKKWAQALDEYQVVLTILPRYPEALANAGAALYSLGDKKSAKIKLDSAFIGDSLAPPTLKNLELLNSQIL